MHRPVGAQAVRFVLLLLLVLAFLPLEAGVHKGVLAADPVEYSHFYSFPTVYRDAEFAPDLVVEAITVNYDSATVVIKNQGHVRVEDTQPFWVDLYVAPDSMPEGPNDVWDRFSTQGIVWAVRPDEERSLEPGETLTMTFCAGQEKQDEFYWPALSSFDGPLAVSTEIAVQVDSANWDTTYGAVLESHEVLSQTYNNISTTVSIAGSGCETVEPETLDGLLPLAQADGLPPRPQHAK